MNFVGHMYLNVNDGSDKVTNRVDSVVEGSKRRGRPIRDDDIVE